MRRGDAVNSKRVRVYPGIVLPEKTVPKKTVSINTTSESEEVIFSSDAITLIDKNDIEGLKSTAEQNERRRVRLCTHPDVEDRLHEMFIVHTKDTYIRPHKHLNKSESLHVIEGTVDLVTFDEEGSIVGLTQLGDYASGRNFYHRFTEPRYHTLVITSEALIFHEVTNGPLIRVDTVRASWSPAEDDISAANEYLENLVKSIDQFAAAIKH